MKYNIYIAIKKKNNNFYSFFIKNFLLYLTKDKIKIIKIIDFGYYFYNNKIIRFIFFKIDSDKKVFFDFKKDFLIFFFILKKNINKYIFNLNLLSNYISKNFKIYSSLYKNIKYKNQLKLTKNIKILKMLKILPNDFICYIKKIIFFYDK